MEFNKIAQNIAHRFLDVGDTVEIVHKRPKEYGHIGLVVKIISKSCLNSQVFTTKLAGARNANRLRIIKKANENV